MASWDSHIPNHIRPRYVIGLGLNPRELSQNAALRGAVLHDLNRCPYLPFADAVFDVVLNTVSVDYLTRPFEVFRDVARVLRPGGVFLVVFSNRVFPQKAVKVWLESSEAERVAIVEEFFHTASAFCPPNVIVSKNIPRPMDDRYAHLGIPSDPIYAVYARKHECD
jgi:SAM-dependent methyltransferase